MSTGRFGVKTVAGQSDAEWSPLPPALALSLPGAGVPVGRALSSWRRLSRCRPPAASSLTSSPSSDR
eukprot:1191451-Prorocentrum_minimum.AAC.3